MSTDLECNDGGPHDWQFAGKGQRRCSLCHCFGFIPAIRISYKSSRSHKRLRSSGDSQGVHFHLCKVKDCEGRAVGKDLTSIRSGAKQWRCTDHRSQYA